MLLRRLLQQNGGLLQHLAQTSQQLVQPCSSSNSSSTTSWCMQPGVRHMGKSAYSKSQLTKQDKHKAAADRRQRKLREAALALEESNQQPAAVTSRTSSAADTTTSGSTTTTSSSSSSSSRTATTSSTSTSSSSTASTTSSSSSSGSSSRSTSAPAWFNSLWKSIGGGSLSKGSAVAAAPSPLQQTGISSDSEKRQRRQQQAAAKAQVENDKGQEQQQDEASATEEAKEPDNDFENQGWVKGLRGLRNYSVTEYGKMITTTLAQRFKEAPIPRIPQRHRVDQQRATYLFFKNNMAIIAEMDLGDKEEIGMDVDAVLRDMDLVHVLADRAALPSMQVVACLQHYRERRRFFDALNEMLDAGITPAIDQGTAVLDQQIKQWQQRRNREGLVSLMLEKRDPKRCNIKPWLDQLGQNAVCTRTQLRYRECCGALHKPSATR